MRRIPVAPGWHLAVVSGCGPALLVPPSEQVLPLLSRTPANVRGASLACCLPAFLLCWPHMLWQSLGPGLVLPWLSGTPSAISPGHPWCPGVGSALDETHSYLVRQVRRAEYVQPSHRLQATWCLAKLHFPSLHGTESCKTLLNC